LNKLHELVIRTMKVPPPPVPPPGAGRPIVFRAADNFFKLRLVEWSFKQLGALFGLFAGLAFVRQLPHWVDNPAIISLAYYMEIFGWITFIAQIPFTFAALQLDFKLRWYIVTDRTIRIREGIFTIREKTMALANIQNMSIKQGPLQRLLGVADVEVRTAGGGGGAAGQSSQHQGEAMHVGYFRGVSNAAEIRDLLREGIRRQRSSGLGDPDEPVEQRDESGEALPDTPTASSTSLEAAHELLAEARLLRAALQ
jgi:membrane protein YdbS with pleckstrin-like domain